MAESPAEHLSGCHVCHGVSSSSNDSCVSSTIVQLTGTMSRLSIAHDPVRIKGYAVTNMHNALITSHMCTYVPVVKKKGGRSHTCPGKMQESSFKPT